MADVEHKNLPDSQRHEPKGISTAAADTVYVSNGLGTGVWTNTLATIKNKNYVTLNVMIPDVSTAGSYFVVNPIAGVISKVYVTIDAAISVADSLVTLELGGVLVTNSTVTLAYSGSAPGSVFSSTPTGTNSVSAGQAIEVITDGASTTASRGWVTLVINVA